METHLTDTGMNCVKIWGLLCCAFVVSFGSLAYAQQASTTIRVASRAEFGENVETPVVVDVRLERSATETGGEAISIIRARRRRAGRRADVDVHSVVALDGRVLGGDPLIGRIHNEVSFATLREGWPADFPDAIILKVAVQGDLQPGDELELEVRVGRQRERVHAIVHMCFRMLGTNGVSVTCIPELDPETP